MKRLLEPSFDTFFGPVVEPIKMEAAARIEALEAALARIYAWDPINVKNPRQTIDEIQKFAFMKIEMKEECETCKHYSFKVWGLNRSESGKCFGFGRPAKYVYSTDCCERHEREER